MLIETQTYRKPPSPTNLTVDVIIDAAIEAVRRDGFERVSLPRLAARLHVTTPAIYHHVRNRQKLLELVADRILSKVEVPPSYQPWQERLSGLLLAHDEIMREHPGLYRFLLNSTGGRGRLRWIEARLRILHEAGFTGATLQRAFLLISFYINPLVLVERPDSVMMHNFHSDPLESAAEVAPGEFPVLRETLPHMHGLSYEQYFRDGLERLIAAVAAEFE